MAKKIVIYKGPLLRAFTDNITLVKGDIVPNIKTEVIKDDELFYRISNKYANLTYNNILFDNEEVMDIIAYYINRNADEIVTRFDAAKKDPSQNEFFRNYLRVLTSCIYYDPFKLRKDKVVDKNDFKVLLKTYPNEEEK